MKKSLLICSAIAAVFVATSAQAVDIRKEPNSVPAPTQPVAIKTLDTPIMESDTKNIQAIVNQDGDTETKDAALKEAPVKNDVAIVAVPDKKTASRTPPIQVDSAHAPVAEIKNVKIEKDETNDDETKMFLTKIRVFAIRWHEVLDVTFLGLITLFTGLLYRAFNRQNKLLARSIKLAEDAARASHRNITPAEIRIVKSNHKSDQPANLELI